MAPHVGGDLVKAERTKFVRMARALIHKSKVTKVGSSKDLGKNLEKIGRYGRRDPKTGKLLDEAAHLVPRPTGSKVANLPSAKACQRILKKYGIDIDDALNGKWLARSGRRFPGEATHGSTHRKVYMDALHNMLKRCNSKSDVKHVMDYVKKQLDQGPWPPY